MKVIPNGNGNETNVRSTAHTTITKKPVTKNGKLVSKESYTYAEVVKRHPTEGRVSFESERKKSSPLTLKK
jgi:hypothetical protein